MGSRMAANLARNGFELTVWNRTVERANELAAAHPQVRVSSSPADAAADAEIVITMVVDGPQVRELLLGEEGAALRAAPGTLFIDCSTVGIAEAQAIGAELAERGFGFLDAPVTGSSPRAQDGTLLFMVGGSTEDFERATPALQAMGAKIVHAGPVGQGQAVKVISNSVTAVNATTLAQAVLVAEGLGADVNALIEVMRNGSAGSTMVELKAAPMRDRNFPTLFKLDHMLKDVRLCLEAAHGAGVEFPLAGEAEQVLQAGSEMGLGDEDFAALIRTLEPRTDLAP